MGPEQGDQLTGASTDIGTQMLSLVTSLAAHRPGHSLADGSLASGWDESTVEGPERVATPVTLLTGFLGAGKSTVLARLLAEPDGVGVVRAVVNDVGRLPFDPTLIESGDRTRVELTNGCGCCVAGAATELGDRLEEMAVGADLLVLEASGAADPAAVAQVVAGRPGLALDRTVVVIDARAIDRLLDVGPAASVVARQLETAEAVILSHSDGLSAQDSAMVTNRVASLVPGCPVVPSTIDDPAHHVLTPGFSVGATAPLVPAGAMAPLLTESFDATGVVDAHTLAEAIERAGPGLLRAKGRLIIDGRPTLVQLTPSGLSLTPDRAGPFGLTAVAADREAMAVVARLFEATEPPAPPGRQHPL